jgi:hypothetical protein
MSGIRAPNIPLGTELSEFIGLETVGTTKSLRRITRANVLGSIEAVADSFVAGGGVIFTTRDQANAALNYQAYTMAWVVRDPTKGNNGVYQKIGAPGTGNWVRLCSLPYSFYRAENVGAGTPNAIKASNQYPIPTEDALVVVNITDENTASPVMLTINDALTPLTIKTSSGNDIAIGGFIAGMLIAGYIDGGSFRLVTDEVSSAIVTAAETARAIAEAARDIALSAVPNAFPVTVAALKALDTATITSAYLKQDGRAGQFAWRTGDFSTKIALDAGEGVYVKADAVDVTAGAWVRLFTGDVELSWFGGNLTAATAIASLLKCPLYLGAKGDTIVLTATWTIPDDLVAYGRGVKFDASSGSFKAIVLGQRAQLIGIELQGPGNDVFDLTSIGVWQGGTNNAPAAPTYVDGGKVVDCYIHDFRFGAIQNIYVAGFEARDVTIRNVGYFGIMTLSGRGTRLHRIDVDTIFPGTSGNAYGIMFTRYNGTETTEPRSSDAICSDSRVKNNLIWEGFDTHGGDRILFVDCVAENVSVGFSLTPASDASDAQTFAPKRCGFVRCKAIGALGDETKRSMAFSISGASTGLSVVDYAEDCFVDEFYAKGYGYDRSGASIGSGVLTATLRFVGSKIRFDGSNGGGIYLAQENTHYTFRDLMVNQWQSEYRDVSAFYIADADNLGHVDGYIFTRGVTSGTYASARGFSAAVATTFSYRNGRNEAPTKTNFSGTPTAYDDA